MKTLIRSVSLILLIPILLLVGCEKLGDLNDTVILCDLNKQFIQPEYRPETMDLVYKGKILLNKKFSYNSNDELAQINVTKYSFEGDSILSTRIISLRYESDGSIGRDKSSGYCSVRLNEGFPSLYSSTDSSFHDLYNRIIYYNSNVRLSVECNFLTQISGSSGILDDYYFYNDTLIYNKTGKLKRLGRSSTTSTGLGFSEYSFEDLIYEDEKPIQISEWKNSYNANGLLDRVQTPDYEYFFEYDGQDRCKLYGREGWAEYHITYEDKPSNALFLWHYDAERLVRMIEIYQWPPFCFDDLIYSVP